MYLGHSKWLTRISLFFYQTWLFEINMFIGLLDSMTHWEWFAFTLILCFVICLCGIYCSSLSYLPSFLKPKNNWWIWGTKIVIWAIIMFKSCTMNIRYCWSSNAFIIELWGLDIDVVNLSCYAYSIHNKGHVGVV